MNEIKPKWFAGPVERAARSESTEKSSPAAGAERGADAMHFARETSGSHALYKAAAAQVETSSQAKIAELKAQIASGTYKPDLTLVAERMLAGA